MQPDISVVAGLIGDRARSRMLLALMSGKALTATELALDADITAQTASVHLAKLTEAGLLRFSKQGRHKYFRLSHADVAQLLENLLNITAGAIEPDIHTGPADAELRLARVCYDHMAGELGVALFQALKQHGLVTNSPDAPEMTEKGQIFFADVGFKADLRAGKRPVCRNCLDWSERRDHLAGQLGQWILNPKTKESFRFIIF
ncbi:ArsR/SmtB family transcription factor [Oceanospirillum sediminis]|uniref:Winged helix-turn-helix transcriptional regulator n=1 Tax=Oceanospirillum sediminis TaxID=2760088 RepID=A0A839INS0_9GAMM|nr:winged helix-turn-helix domain-containing protein [Oceanospirillum sediminis]MBB1485926.1 winged helix-turn-helix transcriptional regulator [Oceanospirillum sediminis]